MVSIFIIILITIFLLLFFFKRRSNFQNIIKASELKTDQILAPQPDSVFVGEELASDYITYDTQFKFKVNENYYLNTGIGCQIRNSKSSCLKKESDLVLESVLNQADVSSSQEKHINADSKTADFKFIEADRLNSKQVNYGDPILIQNIGNTKSYLSLCVDNPININDYAIVSNVYFYNNINDALNNGRWIIIPKFNDGLGINVNENNYNFYEDYDLQKLRSLNIPVKLTDNFLIVNQNKLNGKLVYLNLLGIENSNYLVKCGRTMYNVCVGLTSITGDNIYPTIQERNITEPVLNNNIIVETVPIISSKINLYEWSIEPLKYDVTVFDTLLVEGSLKLGYGDGDVNNMYEITTDTLKYIKSIPYYFKDRICLKPTQEIIENDGVTENSFKCIGKTELEMLNGSRPINIRSTVPAKPITLYSRANFEGRSLRIGFKYENLENLPFFTYNRFLNKGDDGKWKSLSIDGNYIAIIFNKPDYGLGESEVDFTTTFEQIQAEQEAILNGEEVEEAEGSGEVETTNNKNNNNNNNNNSNNNSSEPEVKAMFQVVRPPGIENVLALGDEWKDGIRSIQFVTMPEGDAYELKCLEKIEFKNDVNKRGDKKDQHNLYTANSCVNGNLAQQFYLTNIYDNMPDKEFTLSSLYDDLNINHVHFHRHKFTDKHK